MLAAAWNAVSAGQNYWKPACAVWPWNTVGKLAALFCRVECLETRETVAGGCLVVISTGWALVVVVFWRRINSVCRITWSCWIACGNTVNTVVLVEYTVFEDLCNSCRNCWIVCGNTTVSKIDWRISPWIFSLLFFGNNSVHRIIVLVWMTGSMWIRPYVLLVEEMQIQPLFWHHVALSGQQTLVELHAKWNKRRCTYVHLKNLF